MTPRPPKSRLKFDDGRKELFFAGREVKLAPSEYRVLHALHTTGRALTREELRREIGHSTEQIELGGRVVDQIIARTRRKIGSNIILTVMKVGYKMAAAYL